MNKILLIAQREFLIVTKEPAYLLSLIGVPILLFLMGAALVIVMQRVEGKRDRNVIGVLDHAEILDLELAKTVVKAEPTPFLAEAEQTGVPQFKSYENLDEGMRGLRNAQIEILYEIERDYLQTGVIKTYTRGMGLFTGLNNTGLSSLSTLLRASLIQKTAPDKSRTDPTFGHILDRSLYWTEVKEMNVTSDGRMQRVGNSQQEAVRLLIPLMIAVMLISAVFVSSGYLLRAVVEEKTNRTIEIIMTSVKPRQLIWGKILGLSGAALLQMAIYLLLGAFALLFLKSTLEMALANLAMALLFSSIGFLFYAGLLTGTGIISGSLREGSQLAGLWGFVAMSPLLFMGILLNEPNGLAARVLSFIPFTSATTMIFRLSMTKVPLTEQILALIILAVVTWLSVRAAAKILHAASLMSGKRLSFSQSFNWLIRS